ncbi:MAG: hypothetical protein O2963_01660, partial [Proteobacteria bacterium]|nr:hypothetical protein [Pseudomonadota bacterium]
VMDIITLNNPTLQELINIHNIQNDSHVVRMGLAIERVSTPHLHIGLWLNNAKTFNALRRQFPCLRRADFRKLKGTPGQVKRYLEKQHMHASFTKGEWDNHRKGSGKRNDIHDMVALMKDGKSIANILKNDEDDCMGAAYVRYHRGFEAFHVQIQGVRKLEKLPNVTWLYGGTGSGKSHRAYELANERCEEIGQTEGVCSLMAGNFPWVDGYFGKVVLIDEVRNKNSKGEKIPMHFFLQLFDKHSCRMQTKGGSVNILADWFVITSPFHPNELYCDNEIVDSDHQFLRRINKVIYCKKVGPLDHEVEYTDLVPSNPLFPEAAGFSVCPTKGSEASAPGFVMP